MRSEYPSEGKHYIQLTCYLGYLCESVILSQRATVACWLAVVHFVAYCPNLIGSLLERCWYTAL